MLRVNLVLVMLFVSCSVLAAGNSFGVGVGNDSSGGLAYEPWVKTAKVGDFIIFKDNSGTTQRKEVKTIEPNFVIVEFGNSKFTEKQKYSRKEAPVESYELDMKQTNSGTIQINDKTLKCVTYDGYVKKISMVSGCHGGTKKSVQKGPRYQKVIGEGVPFGGVIKKFYAAKEGKDEKLELTFEVTDFGNVNDAKTKK
ncbi:MAG: hypothetical protein V1899_02405 [Planctomycetota bacterium]